MADILSQSEIDALLSALSTGEVNAEEIKDKEEKKKIRVYDFKRPNKFSKEQLHTLNMIHENFARLMTTWLSAQLRTVVNISVFFVEQMSYNEFISSLPNPSLIAVIDFAPLKGASVLEINPSVAFAIIDRLLGGSGEFKEKVREPTEIENSIIERVFIKMMSILHEAWKDVADINPSLEKIETNSQFVQLISPNEAVALITFNAKVGKSDGMINLCIPHIVIEPIAPKLSAKMWFSSKREEGAKKSTPVLRQKLSNTHVELKAELGKAILSVGEFLDLKVGDVIALDRDVHSEASLYVQEQLKFKGLVGIHNNKMALKVTRKVSEEDEPNG